MAGVGIRIYTDELIDPKLAVALRRDGYDAKSAHEAGMANRAIPDEQQLEFAASQGRAILTFNIPHYFQLERRWKAVGKRHAGIILSPTIRDFRTLLRRVKRHLDTYTEDQQDNILLWLAH